MEELGLIHGGALAKRIWSHSDALKVVLEEPFVTHTGKIYCLHLMGAPQRISEKFEVSRPD